MFLLRLQPAVEKKSAHGTKAFRATVRADEPGQGRCRLRHAIEQLVYKCCLRIRPFRTPRLDPCELRTVVPYTLSERSARATWRKWFLFSNNVKNCLMNSPSVNLHTQYKGNVFNRWAPSLLKSTLKSPIQSWLALNFREDLGELTQCKIMFMVAN
ncbi:hypothetical protein EVAR_73401_1 [Eumeta japonica]|uniref:Uncharacterized protein n=1 Tax=Eumeta variegata TaxID=151549 RepID=A0A4C1SFH2_EUMVA|nr:hypothetical protein EVAR_73401_1 [Eumeta japonica]